MSDNGKLLFECLHGRTLSALAIEMGVSVSNLSRVLNGKGCSKAMAAKLNKHFGIVNNGFVEEKRDYDAERKNTKLTQSKTPTVTQKPVTTQNTVRIVPKYERGDFILYKDGKVGQIRKIGFNPATRSFDYGSRLVEWCRPKEYADHNEQYTILDRIPEKDIVKIEKTDIPKYKTAYFTKNQVKEVKPVKEENNNNSLDEFKKRCRPDISNMIDSMTKGVDFSFLLGNGINPNAPLAKKLLDDWNDNESLKNASNLTPDEKIIILKQIIYKLLSII